MLPQGYAQDGGVNSKMLKKYLGGFDKQVLQFMLFSLIYLRFLYES